MTTRRELREAAGAAGASWCRRCGGEAGEHLPSGECSPMGEHDETGRCRDMMEGLAKPAPLRPTTEETA